MDKMSDTSNLCNSEEDETPEVVQASTFFGSTEGSELTNPYTEHFILSWSNLSFIRKSWLKTKLRHCWLNTKLRPCWLKTKPEDSENLEDSEDLEDSKDSEDSGFKTVLDKVSGRITSGTITALMGPSGAGKSTLMNCISKKQTKGVTGDIEYSSLALDREVRIGFVPQQDCLFTQFTVAETLLFASKMNNHNKSKSYHNDKVREVLQNLDLEKQGKNKVDSLSGGQLKRVSIATELLCNPQILMLDEPTSGLDSDTSAKIIGMLRQLCRREYPPAVLTTIHQPSSEIFQSFDIVYLLNRYGQNIYNGPPQASLHFLKPFGFPEQIALMSNPAEYVIAVANERFGKKHFKTMASKSREGVYSVPENNAHQSGRYRRVDNGTQTGVELLTHFMAKTPLTSHKSKHNTSFGMQFLRLFWRNFIAELVKGKAMAVKILLGLGLSAALCLITRKPVGESDGCKVNTNNLEDVLWETKRTTEGSSFYFMLILYHTFFYGLAGVLTFSRELKVVSKEVSNSWYGVTAYGIAKICCDAILLMFCVFPMVCYAYFVSRQPLDMVFRPFLFLFYCYSAAFLWETRAQLILIIVSKNTTIATILTIVCMFPMIFLCGIFVKINDMPDYIKPIAYISDLKYGLEGIITAMYKNRCYSEEILDDKRSFMLSFFDLTENTQKWSLIWMTSFCVFHKILLLVALKISSKRDTVL